METLNEKIRDIIDNNMESVGDYEGSHYLSGQKETTNELEKLILQEKIDLLNEVFMSNSWEPDQVVTFNNKISELTQQLKDLTTK